MKATDRQVFMKGFEEVLDKVGIIPLPPYIHATLEDRERYQTVTQRSTVLRRHLAVSILQMRCLMS